MRLKVKILELVQRGDVDGLYALLDRILAAMVENSAFLSPEIAIKIAALVIRKDRLVVLRFGVQVLEHAWARFDADACRLIHQLLFPTIFDIESTRLLPCTLSGTSAAESPVKKHAAANQDPLAMPIPGPQPNAIRNRTLPSSPAATSSRDQLIVELQTSLRSLKQALGMIYLEIAVEEAETQEDRVKVIMSELMLEKRTISSRIIWTFLETLLSRSQMDTYFMYLGRFVSPPSEFSDALLEHMDKLVVPKLKYVLAQAIDTQRPTLVLRAILLIAIVVNGIQALPRDSNRFSLIGFGD